MSETNGKKSSCSQCPLLIPLHHLLPKEGDGTGGTSRGAHDVDRARTDYRADAFNKPNTGIPAPARTGGRARVSTRMKADSNTNASVKEAARSSDEPKPQSLLAAGIAGTRRYAAGKGGGHEPLRHNAAE
ncbi:hypothetical protein EVG20_g11337 [Dentipellis fragilis]|uniref:Uncharacterized protein n=1 Tax=Dentipellis fragilis TaxID=205917 RepID=A0A4Y9XN31_9AGAM|nr:hypothetical protein EVG20_g11337 [Dentipellis fragilis]